MSAVPTVITAQPQAPSLLAKIAARYSVEPSKMLATLKATAFKGEVTNEQMMALLIVADQFKLNPWTREIYAFPDRQNGIVPVVGVDGWARIANEHPQFDGMEFVDGPTDPKTGVPEWIEAVIHRKDRAHPTRAREYFVECRRNVSPWQSHPRRMLRHKAMIQALRIAFGFGGIFDEDEAARIAEAGVINAAAANTAIEAINAEIKPAAPPQIAQAPAGVVEQSAPTPEVIPAAEAPPAPATQAAAPSTEAVDVMLADWLAAISEAADPAALGDAASRAEKALRKAPNEVKMRLVAAIQRRQTELGAG
jgi:phage recombination protein Bet